MVDAELAANEVEAATALDSILLKDQVWDDCDIGPADKWPDSLRSIACFVLTLTHPAAIFWGPDLVMIYNEAWEATTRHPLKQGKQPGRSYQKDTIKKLQTYFERQISRPLVSSELLDQGHQDHHYPVLCSPIHGEDDVSGILVQVFCKKKPQGSGLFQQSSKENNKKENDQKSGSKMAKYIQHEETALDRQPFFQKFAEMLPTGLAILNHKADPLFVNHQFHEMTAHRGDDQSFKMWPETIHPEDYERVMGEYHQAFESQQDLSTEFRAYGENQWRLFLMRPLGSNNLQQFTLRHFGGFICALVDISSLKNAEIAQTKVAKEARERKQQQERFIDMISHEIRNPLSAVLHCAEDILDAVQNGDAESDEIPIDQIVEAVRTISLCVAHQKTLVDDVLSFSKLDASMLSLAPRAVKPKAQMADTLKIFQPELRKLNINFSYDTQPDYEKHHVDWVMADLVRVGQVLVNLMTNAIKFTAKQDRHKKIDIQVSAAIERPTSYPPDVVFFETDDKGLKTDATNNTEWGDGKPLYILVAVKDTGIGISKENQAKLFERFRQATPKTEQMYGGSGLGLNIARKLCQLHGGEIGVSSVEGEGSTFGFFFRVRRSGEPDDVDRLEPKEIADKLQMGRHPNPSDVKDKDVPEDLMTASKEDVGGRNSDEASEERPQQTSDMADRMRAEGRDDESRNDNDQSTNGEASKKSPAKKHRRQKSSIAGKNSTDDNVPTDPKPRVLFVEDNLINQKLLKRKIESKGFDVTTAENGKEALDIVQQQSSSHQPAFDCILMDQEMPIMDGKVASSEIRKFEQQNSLPPVNIIGVTANVREEQQKALTDAGMDDVIAKPFKMDELLGKMRRASKS